MELRHLQYFLMVAREGTISGAAHALHLSQPSLSRQMQDLEHELGVRLFDRGSRHIELTAAGMRLRRRAEEIVDLVGRTETEIRVSNETLAGEVRIGSGETPAMELVSGVIAELQRTYPLLRFSLHSGNAQDVRERLDNGLIDFGVFIGNVDLSRYESLVLPARDRWGVFMRRDDPLAARSVLTPDDLAELPLILSAQADRELASWLHRDLADLDVVATYNLLYNAAALARAGVGYVVSLEGIVETSLATGLVFRPLKPAITAQVAIAWKRYQAFSPAAEAFQQKILELWG